MAPAYQQREIDYDDASLWAPGKRVKIQSTMFGQVVDLVADPDAGNVLTISVIGGIWAGLTRSFLVPSSKAQDDTDPNITVYALSASPEVMTAKAFFIRAPSDGPNLTDGSHWLHIGDGVYQCWKLGNLTPSDGKGVFQVGTIATLDAIWPVKREIAQ